MVFEQIFNHKQGNVNKNERELKGSVHNDDNSTTFIVHKSQAPNTTQTHPHHHVLIMTRPQSWGL